MIKYEVNKPFPGINSMPGFDHTRADLSVGFFDIICFASHIRAEEIQAWKKGMLGYGLYVNSDIPFFIIDFDGWTIDVNINILKIKNDEQIDFWLNGEGNIINLFLVDTDTNILKAMRMISIQMNIAESVRDILEKQSQTYETVDEVENRIDAINHAIKTKEMIKNCKMTKL